uniref:Myosin motor domain-containing protein n=1 Tax=Phytophthora ramorum TaxID=164328 RepID=H3HE41_PHYRM
MSADAGGPRRSQRTNGSFRISSDEYAQQQPRASVATKKQPIEEGDFVWVSDESGVCTSAVVVRTGFLFDEESEQEQHVTVVHTEDGEERALRDQPLVKLPACHHPKQLLPLELHDLSNVPLMATNGDAGRTETFTSEQLENVALYTLRARYRMEQVYTWVDRVLVGVNPVTPLPIYTPDHMQAYNKSREQTPLYEKDTVNDAPPHVFALAQNALRCMQDAGEDQAVILLGGMGSGKSEAAKLIVQYLPIQQILHAFSILEAFGNAATPQNPNSSRFAKMISVEFSKHGYVIGGGFTTHYFEKARIIDCRSHERNFHVFYQVLAGVQHDPTLRDSLELNKGMEEFDLLKQADPELTNFALDARDYRDLMSSFSALRIRKNQRVEIVRIVAALLHLGNVDFVLDPEGGKPVTGANSTTILLAAKLLEVEPVVLDNYFRTRQFFSKDGAKTVSSLKVVTIHQARKARDTFIRSLYECLFNFLVETLNGILGGIFDRYEKSNIVINSQGVHVLDMVGFENLEPSQNSFDQLCFNYWSEKVHNFYVQNTLAINFSDLEDESQQVENRLTVHSNVDITSDQEKCLQLFEDKPFGIFDLLAENGKVRAPNDEDFVNKLFSGNEAVGGLSRPNMGAAATNEYLAPSKDWRLLFIVQHHCGKVTYNGKGLSAKNALSISSTCAAIMQSSKNAVLHAVGAAQMAAASSEKAAKQAVRGSTSSKFRNSISSAKDSKQAGESAATDVYNQASALLQALNHTGKNFLVCIKPNEELEEGVFDSSYVMKQIRDNHLVELMQASRSIFTVHLTYGHFFRRYKNVCGHRGTLESLLRSLSAIGVLEEEKFVVGKTKVYLTSHQWKKLEKARFLYLNACATMIQRNMLRGGFRKKSARLLYVMRGLREAMAQRDQNDVIQHLANCTQILGKRASEDIRVLNEGRQLITRLDEEEYVNSIIADATRIGHPALIEYAVRVAEKSSPWLAVDHLRRKSKSIVALQKQKTEKIAAVNKKLRASMVANDPEALMGSLATLEEPSVESLERKLATMMIIRALEEKSAVESVTHALSTIGEEDDDTAILKKLLGPAIKAISLGVEAKLPTLVDTLGMIPTNTDVTPDGDDEDEEEHHHEEELQEEEEKALDDENFIAVERVLARLKTLGIPDGDSRTVDAERALESQTIPASTHSEPRLQQVASVEDALSRALDTNDPKVVEHELGQSISIGFCSPLFAALFDHYSTLRSRSSGEDAFDATAVMDGLHAAIHFLTHRVEANAEIREDAVQLLSTEIEEFSVPSSGENEFQYDEVERERVLLTAGNLRRSLEARIAAATRLESTLALPTDASSVGVSGEDEGADNSSDRKSKLGSEKDALAFNHFENLRGYNAQSERALAKKLCWESRAISQSLSVLDDNPDEVPSHATSASAGQMALSINRCILGYMRDRIVFYREMLAQYILQIGLMKPSLVDEIYLQLMKQLTKNPKRDSSIRGWSLFAMCATSFPPSLALQKYVIMFLKAQVVESNSFWRLVRNFAAYSLKKLENLVENGATGFIPSIDEIRGYEARPPFLATIELLDGTPLADAFPITPELTVSQLIEICSHFLGLEDHVVNFLGLTTISERVILGKGNLGSAATSTTKIPPPPTLTISTSTSSTTSSSSPSSYFHKFIAAPSFLNADVYLGDIFEKELIRGREVRFVFKIRLNPVYMLQYTDEMYDRLVYIQIQDEIVKGNLPVMEEEALLRLSALAVAVDCEEVPPNSVEEIIEMGVQDYLPHEWRPAHDEEEWAELVLDTITDNLLDDQDALFPVSELQRIYIEEVTRHRLYGACFFPSKLLPNYFVIAVNGYGMHILGRDGSMLAFCEYTDIAFCSGAYPQYKICLKKASDLSAPMEDIIVTTKFSEELDALIADYKEITALMNEA